MNNKVVKLAMASVLSGKLAADELFVVDGFNFDKPSTKAAAKGPRGPRLQGSRHRRRQR